MPVRKTQPQAVEPQAAGLQPAAPLDMFARCHAGILSQLESLAQLPALAEAADRARRIAADTFALFETGVMEHHRDEERELFPAVQHSAVPGPELEWIQAMVQRLTREHRTIEALWKRVRGDVKQASVGKGALLDAAAVSELVRLYTDHAKFEEEHFLPVAQDVLGRNGNHMSALGISLHMRHAPVVIGYL